MNTPESEAIPAGLTTNFPTAAANFHFRCLDSYRAMGMFMVFLAHCYFASFAQMRDTFLGPVLDRFDLGLPMFFILSAFLLYRPYVLAQLGDRPQPSYRRFLRHRLVRIIPAYWVALIALLAVGVLHAESIGEALSFFGLVQIYDSAKVFDSGFQPIYQSWSLATEMSFYVLLPVWALALRAATRRFSGVPRVRWSLGAIAGLYVFGVLFRAFIIWSDAPRQAILWLPAWLDMFALGMALAVISGHVALGAKCPRPIEWLGRHASVSWMIAGALFVVVTLYRPDAKPLVLTGQEYMTRQFLYGLISVFWVLPAMFGDQRRGHLRTLLATPLMGFLGAVSLSFYLYHVALIGQVEQWTGAAAFQNNFFELVGIALPITLAIAIASYYLIERPALRFRSPRRPPVPTPRPLGTQ